MRGPGRPRGPSPKGEQSRDHIYRTALGMFREEGYEASTLRAIARSAGVSTGLLYRYFPSKKSVVLRLYEDLSTEYSSRARDAPAGDWQRRSHYALITSLEVLGPHRETLLALSPVLICRGQSGLFSPETSASRARVLSAFYRAVRGAHDAPEPALAEALGRLLYTAHLAIILWWLLDQSPDQTATTRLLELLERTQSWVRIALRLPGAEALIRVADQLVRDALLGESETPSHAA